jgi:hypothetical protein
MDGPISVRQWSNRSPGLPDANSGLTDRDKFAIGLLIAGLGAAIAIVGVFLPLADTESSPHRR